MPKSAPQNKASARATLSWLALLGLAVGTYLLGLGGQYAPSNGDELVYTHIARLTAASNHWLPLVSELDHMRNTKPPLLFWQAMVAGGWGQNWSMAALRMPSVIYTLLIAGAIGWTVRLITRRWDSASLAACLYLSFFSTFRFGRTYLTSAPETFWLNLPLFVLLWWWLKAKQTGITHITDEAAAAWPHSQNLVAKQAAYNGTGWLAHLGFGLAMGLGLAYKSFALIAPAAATLWCAQLVLAPTRDWRTLLGISLKVAFSAAIALSIFGLWFVLDPDPAAVWQEFVVGENAGKMSNSAGYWHTALLGGGFSMWAQSLGYVQNAGLLAFVVLGLMSLGVRRMILRWRTGTANYPLPGYLLIMLVWLGIWLLVFIVPSQRSARYLIPAMPALAMLLALYWPRIARGWFIPSLILCGLVMLVLGRIAWSEHAMGMGSAGDLLLTESAVVMGMAMVLLGVVKPTWTRICTLTAALTTFMVFSLTTVALNGASGLYAADSQAAVQQKHIAVPSSFNGQFERFEFLLPGNRFVPYDGDARSHLPALDNAKELQRLLATHDAVVWLQTRAETVQPLCAPGCRVLGARWEVKGRHQSGEITLANILYPQEWLFRREWLLAIDRP
jgi:hypothetical protein